jgi:hypothetical protein
MEQRSTMAPQPDPVARDGSEGGVYPMGPWRRRAPIQWLLVVTGTLSVSTNLMLHAPVWGAVVATTTVASLALFVRGWLARRRLPADPGLTLAEDGLVCRGVGGVRELKWDEIESYELYGGPSHGVFRLTSGRAVSLPLWHFELYETIVHELRAKLGPPSRVVLGDFWFFLAIPFGLAATVLALFSSWRPLLVGALIGVYAGPVWVAFLPRLRYGTARLLVAVMAVVLCAAGLGVFHFAVGLSGRSLVLWCLTGMIGWYAAFNVARVLSCEA